MISLKYEKTGVFGIQGSGKTYCVEHFLIRGFKHPFVYLMHQEDFTSCKKNVQVYIPQDKSIDHFNSILGKLIPLMKQGKIDCLVVDEADMFFPKDFRALQGYRNIHDFIINHRHYGKEKNKGCALIYMSRRPQDITTNIVETSANIFIFAIEGKNIKQYFIELCEDYRYIFQKLQYKSFNFIYKKLGHKPVLMSKIKLTERGEIKNNEKTSKKDISDDEDKHFTGQ
jgi:hypothetical protein